MNAQQTRSTAISVTRSQNFPEWYQEVVDRAQLAEVSAVKGCMVIKPWGMGIWENIQRGLDAEFKRHGVENAYFPLFVPMSLFDLEAQHARGFATEVAVVTHRRLEIGPEGKLIPTTPLEEPLVVRPTSELIIGKSMADWIHSHRDLPLKLNQWCNVVRMEMRTRLFLRSAEFLWHEGHSAHADEADARDHVQKMLQVYINFAEQQLAVPVIPGAKPLHERFAGAVDTYSIEAMMQDGKALQAGTSHYLGQNFAKAMGIQFANAEQQQEFCHTTSWGLSTRMVGAVVMVHGDDDGLRLPPRVAPLHAVVMPIVPKEEARAAVMASCERLEQALCSCSFEGQALRFRVDNRDIRGGDKNWEWVRKGVPLRIELGPRDAEQQSVSVLRRDSDPKQRISIPIKDCARELPRILGEIQSSLFSEAKDRLQNNTVAEIKDFAQFQRAFEGSDEDSSGLKFVRAPWCGSEASLELLKPLKVTVRCIPFDQPKSMGPCVLSGGKASHEVIFARAY